MGESSTKLVSASAVLKNWGSIFPDSVPDAEGLDLSGCEGSIVPVNALRAAKEYFRQTIEITLHHQSQSNPLREAIAQRHDVDAANVFITAATLDALRYVSDLFFRPSTTVGLVSPDFPPYPAFVLNDHATLKVLPCPSFPFRSEIADIAAFAKQEAVDVLLLSNPNVCTGVARPNEEIRSLIENVSCYVVIDEADSITWDSAASITVEHDNVIVLRSFSKWFGLADLRIGYMIVPKSIARLLDYRLNVCGVSGPSIAAAVASMQDESYLQDVCNAVAQSNQILNDALIGSSYSICPDPMSLVCFLRGPNAFLEFASLGIQLNPGSNYALEQFVGGTGPGDLLGGGRLNMSSPNMIHEVGKRLAMSKTLGKHHATY